MVTDKTIQVGERYRFKNAWFEDTHRDGQIVTVVKIEQPSFDIELIHVRFLGVPWDSDNDLFRVAPNELLPLE